MDISGPGPIGSDCIAMQEEKFLELLETLCPTATVPEGLTLIKVFAPELGALGDIIPHLIGAPDSEIQGERVANLLAWTISLIGHASKQFRPENINGNEARGQVARSAREFIESRFHGVLSMEDLCRHTGVGIRTMQRCFREYFDFTVTDFLKTVRLDSANRELAAANDDEVSVTEVALRNGFTHLGRFSVAYHRRFCEQPSETLVALPSAEDS
jgi:transcriptional regulator GlxA family with amidase domain